MTTKARFMNNNVALIGAITASSAQTDYPVSNLQDSNRTKQWKAAGNFVIDSTNENFYIDDGSPKTVAITNGEYTGDGLATRIETDLNLSSSGWTVSYSSSTYKFSVTHASADIDFSSTTNAIWDTIGYTGSTDVTLSGSPLEADEIRIHSLEYIDIDFGANAYDLRFWGLITSIGSVMGMSNSSTVTIKANNTYSWTSPPIDQSFTRNDQGYFDFLADGSNYRFARIEFQDRTNPNGPGAINASYVYVGDFIDFSTTNIASGFQKQTNDPSNVQTAQSGRRFFNTRNRFTSFNNIAIQLPSRADRLTFEQFVHDFGLSNPFFISIDPGTMISDDLAELTKFVNFDGLPTLNHVFVDYYNIQEFSVREVV